jgi:chromosome partitioning protein
LSDRPDDGPTEGSTEGFTDGTAVGGWRSVEQQPYPFSTDAAASAERDHPQVARVHPQVDDSGTAPAAVSDAPVPRETRSVVSRETRPAWQVRTAGDLAEQDSTFADHGTPLARAAQHSVLARTGGLRRQGVSRPDATRVLVVANQKGGVGKTTSTVNVAAGLAQLGQKVLVIDLDPQGNASTALGIEHSRGVPSTYDMLVEGAPLADVMTESSDLPGLWVVPATIDLAGAEIELVSVVAREQRLDRAITAHPLVGSAAEIGEQRFDYVFVDCPPSLGLLTLNALVAGREMFIPIQAEYYALEGLGMLLETVEMVRQHLNPRLTISTILLTMYDARTRLAAGVAEEVRGHFGDQVLKTAVPRSVRVSEAPSYGQTVMTYDPASAGALSYLEAAREIASKGAPR